MTDLSWICQNNNNRIFRSAKLSDQEKDDPLVAQRRHLSRVEDERVLCKTMAADCKEERVLGKTMTADCKEVVKRLQIQGLGHNEPRRRDITAHCSLDFAQQVRLPNSPCQPGPVCFLTPRKVKHIGVCCDGLSQQIDYLTDEGASSTKGSNAVVSHLHHFFEMHGLGDKHADL